MDRPLREDSIALRRVIGKRIIDGVETRVATEATDQQAILDATNTAPVGGNPLHAKLHAALGELFEHVTGIVLGFKPLETENLEAKILAHDTDHQDRP